MKKNLRGSTVLPRGPGRPPKASSGTYVPTGRRPGRPKKRKDPDAELPPDFGEASLLLKGLFGPGAADPDIAASPSQQAPSLRPSLTTEPLEQPLESSAKRAKREKHGSSSFETLEAARYTVQELRRSVGYLKVDIAILEEELAVGRGDPKAQLELEHLRVELKFKEFELEKSKQLKKMRYPNDDLPQQPGQKVDNARTSDHHLIRSIKLDEL
jgi:hypothetical protein